MTEFHLWFSLNALNPVFCQYLHISGIYLVQLLISTYISGIFLVQLLISTYIWDIFGAASHIYIYLGYIWCSFSYLLISGIFLVQLFISTYIWDIFGAASHIYIYLGYIWCSFSYDSGPCHRKVLCPIKIEKFCLENCLIFKIV